MEAVLDVDKKYIDIGIKFLKASQFDKKTATLDFINKTVFLD